MRVQVPLSAPYQKPLYRVDTAAFIVFVPIPLNFHLVRLRLWRDLCQVGPVLPGKELFSDRSGLLCIALIGYVVALEDAAGMVASDLHNHRLCDSCSTQVPDRCPSQIVKEKTVDPRLLTCQIPAMAKVLDGSRSAGK